MARPYQLQLVLISHTSNDKCLTRSATSSQRLSSCSPPSLEWNHADAGAEACPKLVNYGLAMHS